MRLTINEHYGIVKKGGEIYDNIQRDNDNLSGQQNYGSKMGKEWTSLL